MRVVLTAIVLAFLGSWAQAEWRSRTTLRELTSLVESSDGDRLVVLPFVMSLARLTIVDRAGGPVTSPPAFAKGQRVTVTLRCRANGLPSCSPEKIRLH